MPTTRRPRIIANGLENVLTARPAQSPMYNALVSWICFRYEASMGSCESD